MINNSFEVDRSKYEMLFKKKALIMICCLCLFALIFWNRGIGLIPLLIVGWTAYKYMFPDSTGLETSSSNITLSSHDNKVPKWLFAIVAGLIISGLSIILLSGSSESYSLTIPFPKSTDLIITFNLKSNGSALITAKGGPESQYRNEEGSWKLQGSTMTLETWAKDSLDKRMLIKFNKNSLKLKSVNVMGKSIPVKMLNLEQN